MARGIFYVLDGLAADAQLKFFCRLIAQNWREYRSLRVWCRDQNQAEKLDQALWQLPTDAFVPHNLVGEGPAQGAPVELCWPGANAPARRTAVVLNLAAEIPAVNGAQLVLDRVPEDEDERQRARDRYKQYRQQGIQLITEKAIEHPLSD